MKIKIEGNIVSQVSVDPLDVLYALKKSLGFGGRHDDVCIHHGKIVECVDISYHGSPSYEYRTISDLEDDLSLFKALNTVIKYFE